MANKIFSKYASCYDALYREKDYSLEAAFVAKLITKKVRKRKGDISILDLACGTGRHAIELAKLGYSVDGSDISRAMIRVAKDEAKKENLDITFYNHSFEAANRIGRKYDVILSLFAGINYLTDHARLSRAFENIRCLLKNNGLFIFDFWNGFAVLEDYYPRRVKMARKGDCDITRVSNITLDRIAQMARVKFNFTLKKDNKIIDKFSEEHDVRYFFPQEMADYLSENNFKVIFRCPFMNPGREIRYSDWNVVYIAQPVRAKI